METNKKIENAATNKVGWGIFQKKIHSIYLVIFLLVVAAIILSQYHLVTGTTTIFIKRPYMGFSDMVANIDECMGIPYIVAMANHQSLCKALQAAGYLESDEMRQQRATDEINTRIRQSSDCVNACMYSAEPSKCFSTCY